MNLTFEAAVRDLCPIYGYKGEPGDDDFQIWFAATATQTQMDAAIALANEWTAQPDIDWAAIGQNLNPLTPVYFRYGDRLIKVR